MKNVNRVLIVVLFLVIIALLVAFSSIYPFTTLHYAWQCGLCGLFGLLWIVCILIELWKKDMKSDATSQ